MSTACDIRCVWPVSAELGEGPVWRPATRTLWFTDIKQRRVHSYQPHSDARRSWNAPAQIGFLAPIRGTPGFVAGLQTGLHRFDPGTGAFEPLGRFGPDRPGNRLNDGAADAYGRLWFGSMDDAEAAPTGALWRLDPGGEAHVQDEGYVITNGPAFSLDGRRLYHTDTLERRIHQFDMAPDGGLSHKRLFAEVERGYPDGLAVDAEGRLWVALFGGWGLDIFSPEGLLLEHIALPVANVTKPAFGGPDLRTVYCTTARKGLTAPTESAVDRNAIQAWVLKNTRLAIPVIFHGEALHGATFKGATSFPQAVGLGSTWDRALQRQVFTAVADEARASGNSLVLAPVFDLSRDPRYGRVEEMYSEDPYLAGEMGLAATQGLQGTGETIDQHHVIATAKHFIHGAPQNGTNVGPNDVSERTMRTVFLAPFEKAVKVGHIGAVMPSYDENDGGIPSNANPWLMKDILRSEWGYTGLTISDYLAVGDLIRVHHIVETPAEAGVLAFNSGLDMELPNPVGFPALVAAVRAGTVSQAEIDQAVTRVLTAKFEAGLFEHPYTDAGRAAQVVGSPANAQLARKAADEAMVLLKNDNRLLPLKPSAIRTLAIIGPNADKCRLGGYSGEPPYCVTVLEGVRRRLGDKVKVVYAEGVRISEPDASPTANKLTPYVAPSAEKDAALTAQALDVARSADVVVLVLGENEAVTREAFGTGLNGVPSFGDTDTLDLPGRQNELARAVLKLGKPTVAVLLNGRPLSAVELSQTAPAILEGWYLGQEGGNAVAGVLFGDIDPSGRMPMTVARNVGQLPVFYDHSPAARLGYVFNSNAPLYPFGYGLSYTSFSYGKPSLDTTAIARDGVARVSVPVTNSGARAGDEVVQMYVHPKISSVVQPVLRLAGFERVHLNPGETRTVSFPVGPEQLSIWNRQMKYVVEPGTVDVLVGANVQQTASVQLEVRP